MIDVIGHAELRRVAETTGGPCVSIYVPTHRAGRDVAEDQIRLGNALRIARRELAELGERGPEIEALLAPVTELSEDLGFWRHLERGLVVFADAGGAAAYRLPDSVPELVVVADRFHVTPLLPMMATGESFHVLVLAQDEVRLLRGSRFEVADLGLGDIPPSMAAALRYDDRETQLHSHGATRIGGGRVAATFHGHGVGIDTRDADLARFLSTVDQGLADLIGTTTPLVLAGVESTVARFRGLSRYPQVVEGAILGSATAFSAAELHRRAWPLVEPHFGTHRQRARTAADNGAAKLAHAVTDALVAAAGGRVATVFVPRGVRRWGGFDPVELTVEEHDTRRPGDRDLLDAVVVETLTRGGEVFVVDEDDVPGGGQVAAVLRY